MVKYRIIAGRCEFCGRKPEEQGEEACAAQNHGGRVKGQLKPEPLAEESQSYPVINEGLSAELENNTNSYDSQTPNDEAEESKSIVIDDATDEQLANTLRIQGLPDDVINSLSRERMLNILLGEDEEYRPGQADDFRSGAGDNFQ